MPLILVKVAFHCVVCVADSTVIGSVNFSFHVDIDGVELCMTMNVGGMARFPLNMACRVALRAFILFGS